LETVSFEPVMIAFSARRRWSLEWAGNLGLLVALGCAASQSVHAGAVAPVAPSPPAGAPVAVEEPSSAPASAPSAPDTTAVNVVTLIAKPGLWPLDVESARRVLQALGPVTQEQSSPEQLALVGGPYGALGRFSVAYTLDDQNYWVFGSAGFLLAGSDRAALYHALEGRLIQLLGKPAWRDDESGAPLPTSGWDLGEDVKLSLAPSDEGGVRLVRIAISEPDADSD
jgi:hypothetical protein